MIGREAAVEEAQEFGQLRREVIDPHMLTTVAAQRIGFQRAAAGRSSYAQINPAGIESVKHTERFRNFKRAVVRQQDSTGADADRRCFSRNPGDQDFRRWAGQRLHGVVLCDPVTRVAQALRHARQFNGVMQRVRRSGTGGYRGLINDRELQ